MNHMSADETHAYLEQMRLRREAIGDGQQPLQPQKRAQAPAIEHAPEQRGDPAPHHWNSSDQAQALAFARDAAAPDTGFMVRLLALCTLPRTNPGSRERYVRQNGAYTLVMIAGGQNPKLPYGNLPRLLMAWICTEAVRRQSRTLTLGHSMSEFMRAVGVQSAANSSGGRGGVRTRLQNQMERLFGAAVQMQYQTNGRTVSMGSFIADKMDLWWNTRRPDEPVLWNSTIQLGEAFFNEIIASPVPIDMHILRAMKRSPLGLDLYLWLVYRLFTLPERLTLTWRQIYRQFGSHPEHMTANTVHNFRADVVRELKKLHEAWPDFRYRLPFGRLELRPTKPRISPTKPVPHR